MPVPVLAGVIWAGVTWIFREAVIKFVLMGVIYLIVTQLAPIGLGVISSYLNVSPLTTAFASLPPGVWWFLDFAQLDYGLPLIFAAAIAGFLFRRIPFLNGR